MEKSGITYSEQFLWRLAAQDSGYRYEEFEQLDGEAQSRIVAFYQSKKQMEGVLADEQARKARRKPVGHPGRIR